MNDSMKNRAGDTEDGTADSLRLAATNRWNRH